MLLDTQTRRRKLRRLKLELDAIRLAQTNLQKIDRQFNSMASAIRGESWLTAASECATLFRLVIIQAQIHRLIKGIQGGRYGRRR